MVRLLVAAVGVFLLWQLWKMIARNQDEQVAKRLRKQAIYFGAIALLAFGIWMAASGRLHLAWVGMLGLLTLFRKGMFFYQLWRQLTSFQQGGFNKFSEYAKKAREQATRRRSGMSRKKAAGILGVAENASKEQITQAFRAKMRNAHPDVGGNEKIASELNAARDALLRS